MSFWYPCFLKCIIPKENLIILDITPVRLTYNYNDMALGNWLLIKPEEGGEYKPETVSLESKHEPIVTKVGDKWVIKFKKE